MREKEQREIRRNEMLEEKTPAYYKGTFDNTTKSLTYQVAVSEMLSGSVKNS